MGLPTGPNGVKDLIKNRFMSTWREFDSVQQARAAAGFDASQAVVILDGNVLVRQVPVAASTFEDYTAIFNRFVFKALDAADVVMVVFDEPQKVTKAKAAEQAKRDAQSKKVAPVMSSDLQAELVPQTDDFDYDFVLRTNPHDVMRSREARPRLFDAICKQTMNIVMQRHEYKNKILVFDGIDGRGASRPAGEVRDPCMYSNDDHTEALLRRSESHLLGEGDLKITDLESEIQHLRDSGTFFLCIRVVLIVTIDTDSFAIELMHESAKREQQANRSDLSPPVKTILCFREAAKKRKDDSTPAFQSATFSCFDMSLLHEGIMNGLGADNQAWHRHVSALLSMSWALCGSDFVHLRGMRADVVFDVISDVCRGQNVGVILDAVEAAWQIKSDTPSSMTAQLRTQLVESLRVVVEGVISRLKNMPRMAKSACNIKEQIDNDANDDATLKKGAWVGVYWAGFQCEDNELFEWGFVK